MYPCRGFFREKVRTDTFYAQRSVVVLRSMEGGPRIAIRVHVGVRMFNVVVDLRARVGLHIPVGEKVFTSAHPVMLLRRRGVFFPDVP